MPFLIQEAEEPNKGRWQDDEDNEAVDPSARDE